MDSVAGVLQPYGQYQNFRTRIGQIHLSQLSILAVNKKSQACKRRVFLGLSYSLGRRRVTVTSPCAIYETPKVTLDTAMNLSMHAYSEASRKPSMQNRPGPHDPNPLIRKSKLFQVACWHWVALTCRLLWDPGSKERVWECCTGGAVSGSAING